jgi:hypothetical protein
MWDMFQSCTNNAKEQLHVNSRVNTAHTLISSIPRVYYEGIHESVVVDICRSWTLEPNIHLLREYVDSKIKVIVMERPITEIVKSFAKLYRSSGIISDEKEMELVKEASEPIMRSLAGLLWAKQNNQDNTFLFIQYNELVSQPKSTLDKIYQFCGWEHFEHQFEAVEVKYHELDDLYQTPGQHVVRPKVSKIDNTTLLSQNLADICRKIDQEIGNIVGTTTIRIT